MYKFPGGHPIFWIFDLEVKRFPFVVRLFFGGGLIACGLIRATIVSAQKYYLIWDLCKVKVISNNPGKLRALEEAGLEMVERVSIEVESSGRVEMSADEERKNGPG
jgi:hypothetical protein